MQLPLHTIRRWLASERDVFRPVEITDAPPPTASANGVVLWTRDGHHVEGLDVTGLITVLRALEPR